MALPPLVIKLRCTTWGQVSTLYERDLKRNALFLRTPTPVALGREIRVDVVLPSGTVVALDGRVAHHLTEGERGAGIELVLTKVPPSALWVIESALARASTSGTPEPIDEDREAAAAEQELLAALEAELRAFRGMNAYQILGITYEGGEAAAREAFGGLSKRYHPDRYARFESEQLRTLAAEIFVTLREAYRAVVDHQQGRRTPARGVPSVGTPARGVPIVPPQPPRTPTPARGVPVPPPAGFAPPPARPPAPPGPRTPTPAHGVPIPRRIAEPQAAPLPPPPVVTFNRGQAPSPAPGLSADDLFGDLPDLPSAGAPPPLALGGPGIAHADGLLEAERYDEAIAAYDGILQGNPTDRAARSGRELAYGIKLNRSGDRVGAAERFEAALAIEPWSERAARELAALRRASTDRGKGLLAKLLGKGDR